MELFYPFFFQTWWQKRRLKHGKKDMFVGEGEDKYFEGAKSAFRLLSTSLQLSEKGSDPFGKKQKKGKSKSKKWRTEISDWFRRSKVSAFFGFRGFWEAPSTYLGMYYVL